VQQMFPYGADRWWPGALAIAFTALLAGAAVASASRRDVGAGLLAPRPGPARAAAGLRGPVALAWRLHRGLLAGWIAGFAALGLVFGAVVRSVADLTAENPELARMFERMGGASGATDSFLAGVSGVMGLVAAAYAVQATLRLRDEESSGHAESVLATAQGRLRWMGSHLLFSLAGPALALAVGGAVCGVVTGLAMDDLGGEFPAVLGGMMAQLPAVWVLAALTVLLFGAVPGAAPAAWGAVAACVLLLLVGATLDLSQWVMDVSPFTHIPHLPGGEPSATPFVVLTAIAVVLAGAGLAGFRRRDVPAT
jgi:ABC-2 type transport system permease protein